MAKDIPTTNLRNVRWICFTIGEQMSVALMAMAMDSLGVPSVSLNAFQVAIPCAHNKRTRQYRLKDRCRTYPQRTG